MGSNEEKRDCISPRECVFLGGEKNTHFLNTRLISFLWKRKNEYGCHFYQIHLHISQPLIIREKFSQSNRIMDVILVKYISIFLNLIGLELIRNIPISEISSFYRFFQIKSKSDSIQACTIIGSLIRQKG